MPPKITPMVVDKLPDDMMAASVNALLPVALRPVILQFLNDDKKAVAVVGYRIGNLWYGNGTGNYMCKTSELPEGTIWSEVLLSNRSND